MDGRCLSRIRPTGDISARRLAWLPIQIGRSLGRGWRMTAEDAGVESALARRFVPPGGSGDQPPLAEVGGPGGGVGFLPAAPCQGSCSRRVGKPESESRRCARACGDECLPVAVLRRASPQEARAAQPARARTWTMRARDRRRQSGRRQARAALMPLQERQPRLPLDGGRPEGSGLGDAIRSPDSLEGDIPPLALYQLCDGQFVLPAIRQRGRRRGGRRNRSSPSGSACLGIATGRPCGSEPSYTGWVGVRNSEGISSLGSMAMASTISRLKSIAGDSAVTVGKRIACI